MGNWIDDVPHRSHTFLSSTTSIHNNREMHLVRAANILGEIYHNKGNIYWRDRWDDRQAAVGRSCAKRREEACNSTHGGICSISSLHCDRSFRMMRRWLNELALFSIAEQFGPRFQRRCYCCNIGGGGGIFNHSLPPRAGMGSHWRILCIHFPSWYIGLGVHWRNLQFDNRSTLLNYYAGAEGIRGNSIKR